MIEYSDDDKRAIEYAPIVSEKEVSRLIYAITDELVLQYGFQRLFGYQDKTSAGFVKTAHTPLRQEDVMIDCSGRTQYVPADYSAGLCKVVKIIVRDAEHKNARIDAVVVKLFRQIIGEDPVRKDDEFVPHGAHLYPIGIPIEN